MGLLPTAASATVAAATAAAATAPILPAVDDPLVAGLSATDFSPPSPLSPRTPDQSFLALGMQVLQPYGITPAHAEAWFTATGTQVPHTAEGRMGVFLRAMLNRPVSEDTADTERHLRSLVAAREECKAHLARRAADPLVAAGGFMVPHVSDRFVVSLPMPKRGMFEDLVCSHGYWRATNQCWKCN
jgi:hypothetical protein